MRKRRHAVGSVKYPRSRRVGPAPASAGGCLMWWWSGEDDDAMHLAPRARPVSVVRAGPWLQPDRKEDASLAEPGGSGHPAPADAFARARLHSVDFPDAGEQPDAPLGT